MTCIDRLICRQMTTLKKLPIAVLSITRSQQTVALSSWQHSTGRDPIHVVHIRPSSLFFNKDSSGSPPKQFLQPSNPGSCIFGDDITRITHSDFNHSDRFNLLCGHTTQELSHWNTILTPTIWVISRIIAIFSDVKVEFEYAEFVGKQ